MRTTDGRSFVRLARAVRRAHHELAGRNQTHFQGQALGQFDLQLLLRPRRLLAPFGFRRVKRPASARGHRAGLAGNGAGATYATGFDRQLRDRLRVLRPIGEPGPHLQPPGFHRRMAATMLAPRAVVRNIQVDPGHQPVPGLGVQLDVVMPFVQQLDQFAGRSVVLQRLLQVIIALRARTAHERVQGDVRRRKIAPAGLALGREIRQRLALVLTLPVVAAHAIAIQDRLDLAFEAEPARRSVPGRNRQGTVLAGQDGTAEAARNSAIRGSPRTTALRRAWP